MGTPTSLQFRKVTCRCVLVKGENVIQTKSIRGVSLLVLFSCAVVIATSVDLDGQSSREKVLIRTPKPYTSLEARVVQLGGTVTHKFQKIDAVAAEIPESGILQLRGSLPAGAISKDEIIAAPGPVRDLQGRGAASLDDAEMQTESATVLEPAAVTALAQSHPAAYTVNNGITHVNMLHAAGFAGSGIVVGVIDSGIRPGFPHISLDGSVIGCEDFVLDALGCSNFANNGHGTFVSGMISANVIFNFSMASVLRNSVLTHAPGAFANSLQTQIPMLGSAPLSSIYALRVFGATGGAPTSRILMAIERAIELREQFDAGLGGSHIQVVNMSLGGSTINAGRDLFDTMVNTLLDADIVPVIAASNTGPALVTTGSPGSAFSALTVGAASFTHNERILRDVQFGLGVGAQYRPFAGHQTAYFSSRGPNADGRPDPDVMATGFGNYGQGTGATTGSISIGSGTSYAAPSIAGVAAVLRQAFPSASAVEVRNAIIAGANPGIITDGSSAFDQGNGVVDAVASYNLLATGNASDSLEKPNQPKKKVAKNLEQFGGLSVQSGNVSESSGLVLPGGHHSILYNVAPGTAQVLINVSNFQQTGPGNVFFGDDIILAVHSAKTSSIGAAGDYPIFAFTTGGSFVLNDPEPGIVRVTVYGDWTNTGAVSVNATVASVAAPLPNHSAKGNLRNGEFETFVANVPAGTASLQFELRWQEDWSRYPGADLDLLLVTPSSALLTTGATLDSPERLTIASPAAGNWTIVVDAFEVHLNKANYTLTMIRDGVVVKLK